MGKNHGIHGDVEIFPQNAKGLLQFRKSNRRCSEKEAHYRLGWSVTVGAPGQNEGVSREASRTSCLLNMLSIVCNVPEDYGETTFLLPFFHPTFLWLSIFLSLCSSFSLNGEYEAYILSVWLNKLAEYDMSGNANGNYYRWLLTLKVFLFLTSSQWRKSDLSLNFQKPLGSPLWRVFFPSTVKTTNK